MKIYFRVDSSTLDEFATYCEDKSYLAEVHEGYYFIDNKDNSLTALGKNYDEIPQSYFLEWNTKKIDDLVHNRVLARFNEGKLMWTLMEANAIAPMIQVLMYGMEKYDRDNWKKACPDRLSLMDSLQRHALKIIEGESIDPESGLPHIGHLLCNAMFYSYWEQQTDGLFEKSKT